MTETWGKWSTCNKKPNLKGYKLEETEIFYLEYKVVEINYYNTDRWDPTAKPIRKVTEYTPEEWEKIKNGKIS